MDESHESLLRADSNGGSDTGESSEAQDSDADAGSCRICKAWGLSKGRQICGRWTIWELLTRTQVGALLLALLLLCLAAAATAFRAPLAAYLARRGGEAQCRSASRVFSEDPEDP